MRRIYHLTIPEAWEKAAGSFVIPLRGWPWVRWGGTMDSFDRHVPKTPRTFGGL